MLGYSCATDKKQWLHNVIGRFSINSFLHKVDLSARRPINRVLCWALWVIHKTLNGLSKLSEIDWLITTVHFYLLSFLNLWFFSFFFDYFIQSCLGWPAQISFDRFVALLMPPHDRWLLTLEYDWRYHGDGGWLGQNTVIWSSVKSQDLLGWIRQTNMRGWVRKPSSEPLCRYWNFAH